MIAGFRGSLWRVSLWSATSLIWISSTQFHWAGTLKLKEGGMKLCKQNLSNLWQTLTVISYQHLSKVCCYQSEVWNSHVPKSQRLKEFLWGSNELRRIENYDSFTPNCSNYRVTKHIYYTVIKNGATILFSFARSALCIQAWEESIVVKGTAFI